MLKYHHTRSVELFDWNSLVQETYGRPYHLQQQDGCKPRGTEYFFVPDPDALDFERDSIPEEVNGRVRGVSFKTWLERDPNIYNFESTHENILFWERNFYPSLGVIANDLYEKGLIKEGEYQIEIDW